MPIEQCKPWVEGNPTLHGYIVLEDRHIYRKEAAKETSCPRLQTLLFGIMYSNISFLLSFVGCLDRSKWKLKKHTLGHHYYVSVALNTLYTCFDYRIHLGRVFHVQK